MSVVIDFIYLCSAVIFILGIKQLGRVRTARRGNLLGAIGMFLVVIATLMNMQIGDPDRGIPAGQINWAYITAGIIIGAALGVMLSTKIKMTAMPEMVAFLNGMGGGASVLVAISYFWSKSAIPQILDVYDITTVILSIIIGAVTFTGSMTAVAKLQELISSRPILFKGRNLLNALLFLTTLALAITIVSIRTDIPTITVMLLIMTAVASVLGILLVTPIGGADMPIVICLLNSYSGLAAAATGFVLKNNILIISGALVGSSGIILSDIMCKAMNRSLANVLFGGFGQVSSTKAAGKTVYKNVKECSPEEAALTLESANSVIFIPGYGMAVSQAQHAVRDLGELLKKRGVKVSYAIHPVAGRMPGHMNVLLAEADVPYEQLFEMDQINPEFKNTDVAIIIGANDVVNPAATKNKNSPIYGMPILNAYEAKTVFVVKRSLSPGFAGIDNELFDYDNTLMLFGDAKKIVLDIIQEFKKL